MSGGEKKKKTTRSQGWEEAGSEFYQESYPGDGEMEVLWKDPKRLATLLPSKQTRAGMKIYIIFYTSYIHIHKSVFSCGNYTFKNK